MPKTELTFERMTEINKVFSAKFNQVLDETNKDYLKVATEIEVKNNATVDYAWIADLPSMREWVGDRVLHGLSAWDYTIKKKRWDASIEVDRDVILYDNIGIAKPKIVDLANAANDHYAASVFGLLEENGTCYDGVSFFGEHTIGDGATTATFSNVGANDLTEEGFFATLAQIRRIVKDNGTPIRIRPNLVVVPPELEAKAVKLFGCDRNASGAANPLYNRCEVLVCQELEDDKSWYLLDTTRAIKPIILQIHKKPEFVARDRSTDEAAFMRAAYQYGIDTEDNVGYGLWQLAYKNTIA